MIINIYLPVFIFVSKPLQLFLKCFTPTYILSLFLLLTYFIDNSTSLHVGV